MHPANILDKHFHTQIHEFLRDQEAIEWEGRPWSSSRIAEPGAGGHYQAPKSASLNILTLAFAATLVGCYKFYNDENWIGLALTLAIGISLMVIPEVMMNESRKRTKYAFTKDRVFFQLWRWGKKSIHFIDLADLAQISYQEYEDKGGMIHFLSKEPLGFYTYDFIEGSRRFHPTFEMIPNVVEVQEKLEAFRKDRIKRQAAESGA